MNVSIGTVNFFNQPAPQWRWRIGPVVPKGANMPVELTITREQKCRVFVEPVTAGGQPAPLDGPVQFSISGACTLEPIDDKSVFVVSPGTGVGDSVLTVQADADLGAGVVPLMDTATVHVVDPMASSLGLGVDSPVLKGP